MPKNLAKLSRAVAVGLSLVAAGIGLAQAADTPDSQSLAWTRPGPHEALIEKGAAFLKGGTGTFVSRESIRANGFASQAAGTGAIATTEPDLPTQFDYVFGGVPSSEVTLANGAKLYTACEVHNCLGKRAFLVTDGDGQIVRSAGFLDVKCAVGDYFLKRGKTPPSSCDTAPTLTIFYSAKDTHQAALSLEIEAWAKSQAATNKQSGHLRTQERFVTGSH